jgi:hypothetical protein
MAEPTQIVFSFKEVVTALVKHQGLHEGIWGLYVKFGIQASNMGANENDLRPVAVLPILELGLQKFDKENNLSVDAAKVNPRSALKPRNKPN